ncbi:DUF1906 domain-containing protein [Paenibacillus sanguinis]|uniref:DUF1906 domain-containing protein n=1 Tax=Paenibacillus sanguinis TaxID=225906 RepID=UPI000380CCA2|nr:DUF1906 domain-containing protein [Paenibacillus sanguinis]
MTKGIDCAIPITTTGAKKLAAAGYKFAARYLVPPRLKWKRLNRAEAEAITAAGMQIISVFETTASRPAGGASAGTVDGLEAYQEALLIKQPKGTAIYFAVDYDASSKDYDKIEAYLRETAKQIKGYRVGVYGSYTVIEEMAKRRAAEHFWQTYAWSRGKKSDQADVYQYKNGQQFEGMTVDYNLSYGNEGWWNTAVQDKPTTQHKVTSEDAEKIIRFLSAGWHSVELLQVDAKAKFEFNRLAEELRRGTDIKQSDAEKIIRFLSAGWYVVQEFDAARDEFNRLADAVRQASGLKVG